MAVGRCGTHASMDRGKGLMPMRVVAPPFPRLVHRSYGVRQEAAVKLQGSLGDLSAVVLASRADDKVWQACAGRVCGRVYQLQAALREPR